MKFSISGTIHIKNGKRPFTKTVEAVSEKSAREKVFSLFGSNNGLIRSKIQVSKIEKVN